MNFKLKETNSTCCTGDNHLDKNDFMLKLCHI